MFTRLPLKSAFGAAALAAAGLMLTPATASAQAYSYQGAPQTYDNYSSQSRGYERQPDYGYDRSYGQSWDQCRDRSGQDYCRSERRQRQGTGALVGATFGAVVGSQLGARGRRTEGSVLGAVIGGALGAAAGGDSARDCSDGYRAPAQYGYDDRGYDDPSRYSYDDRGYSSQPYGGQSGYDDRSYGQQPSYGYRSDCHPVAVRTRDSYGRTVTRYQPSC